MSRLVATAAAVAALMFSGVVHGLWSDRWGGQDDLAGAAAQLQALPLRIGDWQAEALPPSGERPAGVASVRRRYVQRTTGKALTLLLACGRPGSVAQFHTGTGVNTPMRFRLAGSGEFWTATVRGTEPGKPVRRTVWAWSGGGAWQAEENPRLAFVGRQRLYSLYLIDESGGTEDRPEDSPCVKFLAGLLPVLEQHLRQRG